MGLLNTLLEAAALGARAKAQKDASARAAKQYAKSAGSCTPCAAGAKVEANREEARKRLGMAGGRR